MTDTKLRVHVVNRKQELEIRKYESRVKWEKAVMRKIVQLKEEMDSLSAVIEIAVTWVKSRLY